MRRPLSKKTLIKIFLLLGVLLLAITAFVLTKKHLQNLKDASDNTSITSAERNHFKSRALHFKCSLPKGWYLRVDPAFEDPDAEFNAIELAELFDNYSELPLLDIIRKVPANQTPDRFLVFVRPCTQFKEIKGEEFLKLLTLQFEHRHPGLSIVEKPHTIGTWNQKKGVSYMKLQYPSQQSPSQIREIQFWLVPRDKLFFLIQLDTTLSKTPQVESDLKRILSSFAF